MECTLPVCISKHIELQLVQNCVYAEPKSHTNLRRQQLKEPVDHLEQVGKPCVRKSIIVPVTSMHRPVGAGIQHQRLGAVMLGYGAQDSNT